MTYAEFLDRYRSVISTNPFDDCFLWALRLDRDGYGRTRREDGSDVGAHVLAWECASGRSVPDGLVVRHTCDTPNCVNSDHLMVGTVAENVADRQRRGRQARGSRNGRSKLDETQVAAAKRVLAEDALPKARLARLLGVDPTVVRDIERGRTWDHVDPE